MDGNFIPGGGTFEEGRRAGFVEAQRTMVALIRAAGGEIRVPDTLRNDQDVTIVLFRGRGELL